MTGSGTRRRGPIPVVSLLSTLGVAALLAGSTLVVTSTVEVSAAATPTLSLTTTAAGASCNDANPTAPVCSGLANGDVVNVSGTGFAPGALASIVQCNSDPAQPVIFFLNNDIPVSCSPLKIVTIPSKGAQKGKLSGTQTMITGTVGPPVASTPDTCTQVEPSTSVITGCSTGATPSDDAAQYPCPPTAPQQAAGDTCVLAIGDANGDRAIGIVLFGTETLPTSTTAGGSTTSSLASTSTTGATTSTSATTTTSSSTTTTLSPTQTQTSTVASPTTLSLSPSGSITDTVTVTGSAAHGSPTGTVTFYACQTGTTQTQSDASCPATGVNHLDSAHLSAGANNTATASSGSFVPTATGTWCFAAVYGGDGTYSGSEDNVSAADLDSAECALVTLASSMTSSDISSATITLGASGTLDDEVTVAGNLVGGAPTGTVTFYACQTGTTQTLAPGPCPATGTPQDAGVPLVTGAGDSASATSSAFTPTAAGTWCFSVVYNGNATYAVSGDNTSGANLDSGECALVAPPPGPAFTSAAQATATVGTSFSFSVTTSGSPVPTLKKKGTLGRGLRFTNNHNGTATLSGVPKTAATGIHHVTFVATFGKGKTKHVVEQAFTLTVVS